MSEETQPSPLSEAQPAKPTAAPSPVAEGVKTLKLNPVVRKPVVGATQSALRPGLKLPTKPGLASGLKLPPKTGNTVSALRPGLKLPPKPGVAGATQTALKPGLKLPPKPVIRKSGETVSAAPLPKPVAIDAQGVGKLPTVDAKPVPREEAEVAPVPTPNSMETLKSVTQKLKGITQQIPQQAILHKTGIISDPAMSDSQKQAQKSKTSRISLSDAMGVAPVKNEAAPMKTIRIKRPIDIPGATKPLTPQTPPSANNEPSPAAVDALVPPMPSMEIGGKTSQLASPVREEPSAAQETPSSTTQTPSPTITQRKTLKITRPTTSSVRPSGKFAVKKSGAKPSATQAAAAVSSGAAGNADSGNAEIADIPDIADIPPVRAMPDQDEVVKNDVPPWATTLGFIVELAASIAVATLAWLLYQDFQLPLYCGGCM